MMLQPLMVAVLLLGGMGVALLGSVKVALAGRLHIDETRVGGLVSLFGFAMIPVILTAGFLTDELGPRLVLVLGSVLFALSLLGLGTSNSYSLALVAVILLSGGWSLLINVSNVLTPHAFPGSNPESKAFATNLANVFFGLGAFVTPLAVSALLRRTTFPRALTFLSGAALVPGVLAFLVDFSWLAAARPDPAHAPAAPPSLTTLLADPMLWICGLGLFFYGPLEASMAAWTTSYLKEHDVAESAAAGMLSTFWLSFMAARLLTALATQFLLPPRGEAPLVLALGLTATVVLAALVLTRRRGLAMALVPLAGLVFGPIFPTLMAILLGHFPQQLHGRAVGLFFAVGGLGWTLVPILIGYYAGKTTVQRGFLIAVGAAIGLSAVGMTLALLVNS